MKFVQLPVGARFEYRGEAYLKTGPLVATNEATGGQQLMMRSAEVKPHASDAGRAAEMAPGDRLLVDRVEAAFRVFYQACEQLLGEAGGARSGAEQELLRQQLRAHRQRFFEQLKGRSKTR